MRLASRSRIAILVAALLSVSSLSLRYFQTEKLSQSPLDTALLSTARASLASMDTELDAASGDPAINQPPTSGFRNIDTDRALDPEPGKVFVVAFDLQTDTLARAGRRVKLVGKYTKDSIPSVGWSVALRRIENSVYPEVYWQSPSGDGGWFTFDQVSVQKGDKYRFALFARPGDFLSLYIRKISEDTKNSGERSNEDDQSSDNYGAQFLGGYPLKDIQTPVSDAPLQFAPRIAKIAEFRGDLSEFLVVSSSNLDVRKIKDLNLLTLAELADTFKNDGLALWIDETGRDRGPKTRAISISNILK